MGTVVTVQDKLEKLAFPTGLRLTYWVRYDPLNYGLLWEPLARGNDGGATVLNADGTFVREYSAETDEGDLAVKVIDVCTTAETTRSATWWRMTAGVLTDVTASMSLIDASGMIGGGLFYAGTRRVLDAVPDQYLK